MSPQVMGLVVGGLVPAVAYALFAIWTKSGSQAGIGAGPFMVLIGTACVLVGGLFSWLLPADWNPRSAAWSFAAGVVWAAGTGLVSFALTRYGIPISKLNPIYNTNTLITVLLGLVVFSEWKQVNALQLLGGATLILVGSLLVSRA
ncbi:MAG: hypothetical protein H6686_12895 [Fibrobacteria bacterium]|nr:hypothetical protein [Fibrobacteria bacterium]